MNWAGGGIIELFCLDSFATSSVERGRVYCSVLQSASPGEIFDSPALSDTFFLAGRLCVFHLPSSNSFSFKQILSSSASLSCRISCSWMYFMWRFTWWRIGTVELLLIKALTNLPFEHSSQREQPFSFVSRSFWWTKPKFYGPRSPYPFR